MLRISPSLIKLDPDAVLSSASAVVIPVQPLLVEGVIDHLPLADMREPVLLGWPILT